MAFYGRLASASNRFLLRPVGARQATDMAGKMPARADIHPNYFKLKETQAKFKENLHLPVHRKGGRNDDIMRYITYAIAGYVAINSVLVIYELSYPPKK